MPGSELAFTVSEENGLSYPADVLVLKHAQSLYGLDARVVDGSGIDVRLLPEPGAHRKFSTPSGVAAGNVLFIGTRPIGEFTYADVRQFGYKALCSVASGIPDALEVAVTLHGVGYGLDEVECFDAELAGLLDAIEHHDVPRRLERVTFLEINPGRALRMRERLASLLGPACTVTSGSGATAAVSRASRDTLRAVGSNSENRSHAFVAMPFDETFSDVFHYGLANAVRANDLLCERIDEQAFVGDVVQRLKAQIRSAKVVVADVTGANANVFLEVGFAWGHDVPTILVCRKGDPLKFDIQGQRCIFYESIRDLETQLKTELERLLPQL